MGMMGRPPCKIRDEEILETIRRLLLENRKLLGTNWRGSYSMQNEADGVVDLIVRVKRCMSRIVSYTKEMRNQRRILYPYYPPNF